MGWLSLLSGLIGLAKVLAQALQERQMLNAGKAEAIVEGLDHAMAFINDAKAGAAGIDSGSDPEWRQRVLDKWKRK